MSDVILEVKNLEKTYVSQSENLVILKDLNMTVHTGEKCVIVGSSGSGKSTLLNMIGGLDIVTSGEILINGKDICKLSEKELTVLRQKTYGYIFQFHYLLKDFTALENIFLPAYIAGLSKKEAMEKAEKLLDDVGLSSRKNHLPSQLSGGERQRIAVARSLVNNPELILADEPTGNLDPANAKLIGEILFSMAEKYNKTLILVTHDLNLAQGGDVKYFIKDGKLVEEK